MKIVRQVSLQESPVLLLGETGVGKDVIANAIHKLSQRKNGPFISVNCGAFTGAFSQKRGRFERADKGTIISRYRTARVQLAFSKKSHPTPFSRNKRTWRINKPQRE